MEPLYGQIRPYAWGSRQAIARIQGRPVPSPGPEAELWLDWKNRDTVHQPKKLGIARREWGISVGIGIGLTQL